MVDKILNASKKKLSNREYKILETEVLNTNNARLFFLLAYYIKNANINLLSERIIETNDFRYIQFFMRSIKNCPIPKFIEKTLELGNARDLYYCIYDNRNLSDKDIYTLLRKIYQLKDMYYFTLGLYFYFDILNRYNDEIFCLLYHFPKTITKNNYRNILKQLKDQYNVSKNFYYPSTFSTNFFRGRKQYIPDMIVLHNTSNFNKAIQYFYDRNSEVSAHFIINVDGTIKQIVSLEDSAWANGTSLQPESDVYYKFSKNEIVKSRNINANYYTFSIEHISFDGELTEKAYQSSLKVIKKIILYVKQKYHYNFIIDSKHIVFHRDINPIVRTICPGLTFPLEKLIKDLRAWQKNKIYKEKQ